MIANPIPRSWKQLRPQQPVVLRASDGAAPLVAALGDHTPGESLALRWPAHAPVGGWFPGAVLEGECALPDGLWRFRAEVRRWSEGTRSLVLNWPFQLTRVQRRGHARVRASAPARLRVAGDVSAEIPSRALDLSTGGARFAADAPVAAGRTVAVELDLPDGRLECLARVVRCGDAQPGDGVWIAVEWLAPSLAAIRSLSRFVTEGQSASR